jgi:hypothetical protein
MSSNNSGSLNRNRTFGIFMIFIAILLILYFIYSMIAGYQNYKKYSPYLVNDIITGNTAIKINSYQVPPPQDNQYGTEFSYSFWIYINDTNFSSSCTDEKGFKHVFHKGSYDYNSTHLPLLQSPGVWLYPNTNKFNIRLNTFQNVVETCDVGNIPMNAWVHCSVILIGNSVDVFINGNLKKRQKLRGVPKLNYDNLYVTNWGGFDGNLCRLRYFNYAIQPFMIEYLFNEGPSSQFDSQLNTNGLTNPTPTLAPQYWMRTGFPNSNVPK